MHANEQLIRKLYEGFQQRDPEAMAACYHPEATFTDAAFQHLKGTEIRAMWRMLLAGGTVSKMIYTNIHADETTGSGHWEAWYTFSGRPVHNAIDSEFAFLDGLIISQHDTFSFPRWAGQALGWPGKLLGRLPLMQKLVQLRARKRLNAWIQDHEQEGKRGFG